MRHLPIFACNSWWNLVMVTRGWLGATLGWFLAPALEVLSRYLLLAGHQTDPLPEGIHLSVSALFSQMRTWGIGSICLKWAHEARWALSLLLARKDAPEGPVPLWSLARPLLRAQAARSASSERGSVSYRWGSTMGEFKALVRGFLAIPGESFSTVRRKQRQKWISFPF